jgi:hypothetical protein
MTGSVPSNAMMSSPSAMEPQPININITPQTVVESPPTFAYRVRTRLSAVRTWCTLANAFKTLLVLSAVSVGTVYTINVIESAIAPSVAVAGITPICASAYSCNKGQSMDFLVKVVIGGRSGYGETASQVALYQPIVVASAANSTEPVTTFQYLGQGKLVAAIEKTQPAPQFNVSAISNMFDMRPDHQDLHLSGVVTLPASAFTDRIYTNMIESQTVTSTVVLVEVQTFIRQWFKDLQFIRNQQVAVSPATSIIN